MVAISTTISETIEAAKEILTLENIDAMDIMYDRVVDRIQEVNKSMKNIDIDFIGNLKYYFVEALENLEVEISGSCDGWLIGDWVYQMLNTQLKHDLVCGDDLQFEVFNESFIYFINSLFNDRVKFCFKVVRSDTYYDDGDIYYYNYLNVSAIIVIDDENTEIETIELPKTLDIKFLSSVLHLDNHIDKEIIGRIIYSDYLHRYDYIFDL